MNSGDKYFTSQISVAALVRSYRVSDFLSFSGHLHREKAKAKKLLF